MTESTARVRVIEETSAYWRVLFENPPFNIVDSSRSISAGNQPIPATCGRSALRKRSTKTCRRPRARLRARS